MWNNVKPAMMVLLMLALTACHTTKKTVETTTPKALKSCEDILNHQIDWQTIDISRMEINIQLGQNAFTTKGSLKMVRDSVILLSVQPLAGIEMARARITKDSIVVIDRFNSRYFAENIKSVAEVFEFEFLQSLLSNRIFSQKVNAFPYPDGCELRAGNTEFDFNFFVNTTLQLEKTIITDKTNPYSLTCEYADFAANGETIFPNKLKFIVFYGQKPQQLNISVQKIDFNKPVNAAFSIPARYKKADFRDFTF
ncbi:MAG: DUF4292 domain-containing protein [Prevotellaceae bacterium]|jgi:hypothetical protein|nr:DUF4292 domain-containing protein [Prevotellaceae bacterium]